MALLASCEINSQLTVLSVAFCTIQSTMLAAGIPVSSVHMALGAAELVTGLISCEERYLEGVVTSEVMTGLAFDVYARDRMLHRMPGLVMTFKTIWMELVLVVAVGAARVRPVLGLGIDKGFITLRMTGRAECRVDLVDAVLLGDDVWNSSIFRM